MTLDSRELKFLIRQIDEYIQGDRIHDPDGGIGSWRIRVGPKPQAEAEPRQTDRTSAEEIAKKSG